MFLYKTNVPNTIQNYGIKRNFRFLLEIKKRFVEKSEIKLYNKYIGILSDLINRDLTQNQIHSIEVELETLQLSAELDNRKKYLNQN